MVRLSEQLHSYVRSEPSSEASTQEVTIELIELITVLNQALAARRVWVDDFSDEKITISSDLHEVLLAAKNYG